MKTLKWILLAVLVFLLQTQSSFIKDFFNLPVVLVYYFGLKSHSRNSDFDYTGNKAVFETVAFGVVIGLAEDVISSSVIDPDFLARGWWVL